MSRSRSTRALIAVAVSSALLLAGCSAGQTGGGGATEPQTGGTLNYLEHQPHTSLYPPSGGFYPNGGIVNNITDRLVYQNPETLEFEPWIATDWESNEDATEYTFNLRSDVTFSDGTPLDAAVVAKNFDLYGLGDPDRALPVSEAINNYERSEVVDADTVKFYFTAPAPGFLQATSTINSGLVSDATLDLSFEGFGPGNSQNVIGSGPFTISGEEIGTRVDLAAREDYAWAPPSWTNQGRPYLDGITITVTPEDSVRVGALVSGQADIVRNVEAQDEAQVEVTGYSILAAQTKGVNNGLSLRIGNEKLSDIRVRQAITAGIDRQAVVDTIYSANYPLATSVLSSSAPGYVNTEEYFAYDQAKAKSLLDEAGWVPGADGIREKGGQKLTLVVNEAAPQPRSFEALTLISQQLAEIGVDLQILKADAGTYAEAVLDADQVQIYHSMVGRTDLDVIKSQFYSSNRNVLLNKNNETGQIVDPKLEELLLAVASTPDPDQRIAASQAVQVYLAEQAYQIPLFEEPQVYGQADYVHGFQTESIARPIFSQVWLDR